VDATAALLEGYCHASVMAAVFPHTGPLDPPPVDSVVTAALHGIAPGDAEPPAAGRTTGGSEAS
jgi:hypothetical protein